MPATSRTRARHACRVCNSRRVKCNVMEVHPCDNCATSGVACEVVPSRRGRYPRRSKRSQTDSTTEHRISASPQDVSSHQQSPSDAQSLGRPGGPNQREAERGSSPSPAPGSLFFGESNFLTLVPGENAESGDNRTGRQKHRLHFPLPGAPPDFQTTEGTGVSASTLRYLEDEGAFILPELETCIPALQAYFNWFHPCFPVVDRAVVTRQLASNTVPKLLLQCMLFVSAKYCDEKTLNAMGFEDRSEAKTVLYTRARRLHQADWEKDVMIRIQCLFLLSFWRGGPSDIRDVRYWLGVVLTLSETYGLHRALKFKTKDAQVVRMRRRIWWSIYVRERQSSVSLGLPCRIRDEDCDIEPLSASDLESGTEPNSMFGICQPKHVIYVTKMVEIARLLGKTYDTQFVLGKQQATLEQIQALDLSLETLKSSFPDEVRYSPDEGGADIWTCLLHVAYNHLRILIHRSNFLRFGEGDKSEQIVINAACQITRIAEDMSTQSLLQFSQMHVITSLFAALCCHCLVMSRGTGISKRLAEHRAQMSLMCLKEIQRYWSININLLDLFLHYLDSSLAKRLNGPEQSASGNTSKTGLANDTAARVGEAGPTPTSMSTNFEAAEARPSAIFEDPYFNLVSGNWEGEDALGNLGLFLQGDDFIRSEGLELRLN